MRARNDVAPVNRALAGNRIIRIWMSRPRLVKHHIALFKQAQDHRQQCQEVQVGQHFLFHLRSLLQIGGKAESHNTVIACVGDKYQLTFNKRQHSNAPGMVELTVAIAKTRQRLLKLAL